MQFAAALRTIGIVAAVLAALPLSSAVAQTPPVDFQSVLDVPTDPIAPADMYLEIWLESDFSDIFLYDDALVTYTDTGVLVDLYAETGFISEPDTYFLTVQLGTFEAGYYEYTVVQSGVTNTPTWTGSFTVLPEPGTLGLLALACPLLLRRRR